MAFAPAHDSHPAPPAPGARPTLADLFPGVAGADDRAVTGLTADSRTVEPGAVFVAASGARTDGARFMGDAAGRGAAAIVAEGARPPDLPHTVAFLPVPDARRALALAAARVHPGAPGTVVAVTGTSGKSSVADFARQIFGALGRRSASVGTVGVVTAAGARYGSLTTPDPVSLHNTLSTLAREGITHLALEASSHGLDQRRLDGVDIAAAAFTNLGRDHLDYHASTEEYLRAKLRLFDTLLRPGRPAVINADGAEAERVAAVARARGADLRLTGRAGDTLRLLGAERDGFDQHLTLGIADRPGGPMRSRAVRLPLAGAFQVENALVAAGLCIATMPDHAPDDVVATLAKLVGVPGRMERIGEVNGALCIVDYAHKPDALHHVLAALRPFATGRLVCVFGCGGDRDRGKRPLMGTVAAAGADRVIVTDDNPRTEDPAAIRSAIMSAAPGAREIGDRAEAIRVAVAELGPGDVLVVAGKGHETGQIVGDRVLPFSDADAVRTAAAERG